MHIALSDRTVESLEHTRTSVLVIPSKASRRSEGDVCVYMCTCVHVRACCSYCFGVHKTVFWHLPALLLMATCRNHSLGQLNSLLSNLWLIGGKNASKDSRISKVSWLQTDPQVRKVEELDACDAPASHHLRLWMNLLAGQLKHPDNAVQLLKVCESLSGKQQVVPGRQLQSVTELTESPLCLANSNHALQLHGDK
jgi:hypothetical protein